MRSRAESPTSATPAGSAQLDATVRGSGSRLYTTVAEFDDDGLRWWGECSCPVGLDCKHVAAVLLVAREALDGSLTSPGTSAPDWERVLTDLVGPATPPAGPKSTPLGLQFEVEAPAGREAGVRAFLAGRCGCARS